MELQSDVELAGDLWDAEAGPASPVKLRTQATVSVPADMNRNCRCELVERLDSRCEIVSDFIGAPICWPWPGLLDR
jgi:hypothetical protein